MLKTLMMVAGFLGALTFSGASAQDHRGHDPHQAIHRRHVAGSHRGHDGRRHDALHRRLADHHREGARQRHGDSGGHDRGGAPPHRGR